MTSRAGHFRYTVIKGQAERSTPARMKGQAELGTSARTPLFGYQRTEISELAEFFFTLAVRFFLWKNVHYFPEFYEHENVHDIFLKNKAFSEDL